MLDCSIMVLALRVHRLCMYAFVKCAQEARGFFVMKAVLVNEFTGPSGVKYGDIADIPDEVEGSVVIDVRAVGVCFPDLLQSRGEYQVRFDPPFVPGMECAGTVRSAPAGTGFKPGDRVMAFGMAGAYAERAASAPELVVPSPPELDDAESVTLLVNYFTVYFALVRRAALMAGDTVLVLGSAGGVGSAAIQVAKALGARVIAVVRRAEAYDFVGSLGADVVLPLDEGWAKAVRAHTGDRGVDIVVDPVGGSTCDDAVRTLAPEGRLLVIGYAGGEIPAIKTNRLLLRNAGLLGVEWGKFSTDNPDQLTAVAHAVGHLVQGGLRPPNPMRYPLSEGRTALEMLDTGKVIGKIVLEV